MASKPKAPADKAAKPITPDVGRKKFALIIRMMNCRAISPIAYRLGCLLLLKYRNEKKGGLCYPAIETLAADLEVNEKTIRRAIKEIVDNRFFTIQRAGGKRSNRYWPVFLDRTQESTHGKAGMSDHESDDRTFDGGVSGHFRPDDRTPESDESSLEPNLEPRAGLQPARGVRTTAKVVKEVSASSNDSGAGGARLKGAPPLNDTDTKANNHESQKRVDENKQAEPRLRDGMYLGSLMGITANTRTLGAAIVIEVYPDSEEALLRSIATGETKRMPIPQQLRSTPPGGSKDVNPAAPDDDDRGDGREDPQGAADELPTEKHKPDGLPAVGTRN
ncbi:helix-turn-helix domain-containing protein [Mesorhizobium sp. M0387]|uniref:helix-turn-helix domain-containing protein n=1 Tax=Mesorhizobium sp. M0387 TaxID=2956940 RepID=UPI003336DB67